MGERASASDGNGAGVENLDKVRDILFGSQMRDQDKRFARLEERLAKDIADVREESRRRLDTLEAYVKKEVQSLLERMKGEKNDRTETVAELAKELKEMSKGIEKRIVALDEQHAAAHTEIRQELMEQSKMLRDELVRCEQDLAAAVDSSAKALGSEKADRAALAALFNEMAVRVSESHA